MAEQQTEAAAGLFIKNAAITVIGGERAGSAGLVLERPTKETALISIGGEKVLIAVDKLRLEEVEQNDGGVTLEGKKEKVKRNKKTGKFVKDDDDDKNAKSKKEAYKILGKAFIERVNKVSAISKLEAFKIITEKESQLSFDKRLTTPQFEACVDYLDFVKAKINGHYEKRFLRKGANSKDDTINLGSDICENLKTISGDLDNLVNSAVASKKESVENKVNKIKESISVVSKLVESNEGVMANYGDEIEDAVALLSTVTNKNIVSLQEGLVEVIDIANRAIDDSKFSDRAARNVKHKLVRTATESREDQGELQQQIHITRQNLSLLESDNRKLNIELNQAGKDLDEAEDYIARLENALDVTKQELKEEIFQSNKRSLQEAKELEFAYDSLAKSEKAMEKLRGEFGSVTESSNERLVLSTVKEMVEKVVNNNPELEQFRDELYESRDESEVLHRAEKYRAVKIGGSRTYNNNNARLHRTPQAESRIMNSSENDLMSPGER